MKISVLGTGSVGRTVAPALAALGHDVVVGTRDPDATRARDDWTSPVADLPLRDFATVAQDADLVVNATNGQGSLAALGEVGAETLAGKVVLDLANPLDTSQGFPPTLSVKDTDSLAEQIQRAFPEARVVKALNTLTAGVAMAPASVGDGGPRCSRPPTTPRPVRWSSGCSTRSAGATSSSSTSCRPPVGSRCGCRCGCG